MTSQKLWVRSFGVAAALFVPAFVVAQVLPPDFPGAFRPSDVLTAQSLNAMRQAIENVSVRRVAAPVVIGSLSGARPTATLITRADGIITLMPTGSGFAQLEGRVSGFNASLLRALAGHSGTVTLPRDATVTVEATIPAGNSATLTVLWTSLEGPDAARPVLQ